MRELHRGGWPAVWIALLAVLAVAVVAGLYLVNVWRSHFDLPPGNDIPQYLLRTRLAVARGLHTLVSAFPSPFQANPDRPGFPAFASVLQGMGIPTLRLEFVLPAVGAAIVGLAAGGFAMTGLAESPWAFPVYVLAVGASVNVAVTASGHFDNLLVDGMCLGAFTAALQIANGEGRAAGALVVFTAAAVVTHWMFAILLVLILLGLVCVLGTGARWSGGGPSRSPARRLGAALGLSVAAGAGSWLLVPGFQAFPVVAGGEGRFLGSVARTYRLPVLGPVAAGGAARLLPRKSRPALALLLIWTGVGVAALLVLLAGRSIPADRVWPFALSVPILAATGVVGLIRPGRAVLGRMGLAVAIGVVVAGLFGQAWLQRQTWRHVVPLVSDRAFAQAETIGRYMDSVGGSRPVVVAVNTPDEPSGGIRIAFRWIRAAVPLQDSQRVFVYLGTVPSLLADRPDIRPGQPGFDRLSRQYWPEVRDSASRHPIVLVASEFYRGFGGIRAAHAGSEVAPGLAVIRGPTPHGIVPAPPPRGPSRGVLVGTALWALMVTTAIGLAWSLALLSGALLVRLALAPAFGVAVAALVGLVADRSGFRLSSGTALAVGLGAMAAGWGVLVVRRWLGARPRGTPSSSPVEPHP